MSLSLFPGKLKWLDLCSKITLCVMSDWAARSPWLELSSDSAKNTETQIYKITQIEGVFCQFFVCFLFGVFCHPWSLTRVVKSGEGLRVILVLGCFYKGWGPIASLKQNQDVLVWFGYKLGTARKHTSKHQVIFHPLWWFRGGGLNTTYRPIWL